MTRPRPPLVLLALAAGLVALAIPAPAAADPARPTDFRSDVLSVEPELPAGVELSVVGGDAFLELRAARGHTVVVLDYEQGREIEPGPYLRFRADGVVEQNDASLAAQVNDDRFGAGSDAPVEPGAPPRWRVVARDGRHAWHDHRIHWMLPSAPTAVDDRGRVDLGGDDGTWEVPLVVDGEAAIVRGELVLLAAPSPLPWVGLALAVGFGLVGVAVAAGRRGRVVPHAALAAVAAGVGLAATAVAAASWLGVPPETGPAGTSALLAALSSLLAVATVVLVRSRRAGAARATFAATAAALGGWGLLRLDVLSHAWLPTPLPFAVDRGVTAAALGAAAGLAVVLVWRPPVVSASERLTGRSSEPMDVEHGADRSSTRA